MPSPKSSTPPNEFTSPGQPPEPVVEPVGPELLCVDFCRLRSATMGRRIEILNGFMRSQSGELHLILSESEWEARYLAFLHAPATRSQ